MCIKALYIYIYIYDLYYIYLCRVYSSLKAACNGGLMQCVKVLQHKNKQTLLGCIFIFRVYIHLLTVSLSVAFRCIRTF